MLSTGEFQSIDSAILVSFFDKIKGNLEGGVFPERVMMTFHPQRWTDNPVEWGKELMLQRMKNGVKYVLVKVTKKKGMD